MCRNSAMKVEHSGEEVPHVAIRLFGATIPIASADRKPSLKRSAEFQNADEPSQRRQKSFRPDPETEKPSQVRLVAGALNFWKTEKAEGSMISLNHGSAAVGFTNPFNSEEIILSERESLESKLKNTESSFSPLDKEGILGFSLKSLWERKSAVASFSDSLKSDDEVRLSLNTPPPEHEASESKSFTTTSLSSDEMKLSLNASELSCSQTSRRNAAVTLKSETATATPTLPPVHESVESRPLTGKRAAYQRKTDRAAAATSGSKAASSDKPQMQCPRCESSDTKFCYYNNYNVNQPRYFCKNCRRYWTAGGTMRNIPVGAGRRKSKHFQSSSSSNTSEPEQQQQQQQIHTIRKSIKSDAATHESTPPLAAPCFEGLNSSGILNSFMAAAAAQGMSSSSSSSALFKEANSRAAAAAAAAATASPWLFPCPPNFLANSSLIYGKPLAPENAVNGNHVVISQGL